MKYLVICFLELEKDYNAPFVLYFGNNTAIVMLSNINYNIHTVLKKMFKEILKKDSSLLHLCLKKYMLFFLSIFIIVLSILFFRKKYYKN